MINRHQFQQAARHFRAGRISLNEFSAKVFEDRSKSAATANPEQAVEFDVDLLRKDRCGWPEVVFGEGKSFETTCQIVDRLLAAEQSVLVTRIDDRTGKRLQQSYDNGIHNARARTFRIQSDMARGLDNTGRAVAVVSAGTADLPVAEEAAETLRWMQVDCHLIVDVGVAGPQRLEAHISTLKNCEAIVVVAGMEAALPSVVAGHVACPVIAVPTSVGYGLNLDGVAALLGMLNSCAANVVAVNVDAGFKAGYVAGMIAAPAKK